VVVEDFEGQLVDVAGVPETLTGHLVDAHMASFIFSNPSLFAVPNTRNKP
jgi:hypothetical protein